MRKGKCRHGRCKGRAECRVVHAARCARWNAVYQAERAAGKKHARKSRRVWSAAYARLAAKS